MMSRNLELGSWNLEGDEMWGLSLRKCLVLAEFRNKNKNYFKKMWVSQKKWVVGTGSETVDREL